MLRRIAKMFGLRRMMISVKTDEIEQRLRAALAGNESALVDLDRVLGNFNAIAYEAQLWPHVQKYNRDVAAILGHACAAPTYFLHTSWALGSKYGDLHNGKLAEIFVNAEQDFIEDLHRQNVEGSIVEFGVFEGYMLGKLLERAESIGGNRMFYGFDSFEGLSEPSKENDYDSWEKGQFAAGYDLVARNLKLSERPHLKLIKGWVEDSLKSPEAQSIKSIAYARIDVDIYDPTWECLEYISTRLANGAILAFDDWAYTSEKGESKAFIEWVPTVPHLRFEWIGQCSSRFYLKVYHR